jgi:hypothetical protein
VAPREAAIFRGPSLFGANSTNSSPSLAAGRSCAWREAASRGPSSGDDLADDGQPQAAEGDEVHEEAGELGAGNWEPGAVEDEHLRDEDPRQEATLEPLTGGRRGVTDAQDASANERRGSAKGQNVASTPRLPDPSRLVRAILL